MSVILFAQVHEFKNGWAVYNEQSEEEEGRTISGRGLYREKASPVKVIRKLLAPEQKNKEVEEVILKILVTTINPIYRMRAPRMPGYAGC
ncbi:hypothetical protein NECAME_07521 [Necator americanus]|uniref:Uncharacterized protein n=1 Tax=Necator americanus TaxID=51031 RepID=W2TN81_NECAM|nr:hypothetical protein NECAME_07521 [Necator americanus]ETN83223.1 hypothetical protein NECAME_07521 [Necator americanus]